MSQARRLTARPARAGALATLVVLSALLAGCGATHRRFGHVQHAPSPVVRLAAGTPEHVAVIVMENEEYSDIIGSAQTPYINRLASEYALARSMFAISHPSLPNYLALTGGSTFGISSDCTDCSVAAAGLGNQLQAAHVSWKAYLEGLPPACYTGAGVGEYAKKHNPFIYYRSLAADPVACSHLVALTRLADDERAGQLPQFMWITPNLCHDMHDCSPATGDRFLSELVPPLLAALGRRGLLFLTWDEGTSDDGCCHLAAGGHVVTIVAGPGARAGARLDTPADHYSTLQAVEDLLGLRRQRGAACSCTPSLAPLLKASAHPSSAVSASSPPSGVG